MFHFDIVSVRFVIRSEISLRYTSLNYYKTSYMAPTSHILRSSPKKIGLLVLEILCFILSFSFAIWRHQILGCLLLPKKKSTPRILRCFFSQPVRGSPFLLTLSVLCYMWKILESGMYQGRNLSILSSSHKQPVDEERKTFEIPTNILKLNSTTLSPSSFI